MNRINGLTVVVTGAAAGIGRALVKELAANGAQPLACDIDEVGLASVKQECAQSGYGIRTARLDVTDRDAISALAAEVVAQRECIDVWINNAGIARNGRFLSVSPADCDLALAVNFRAVIDGSRAALIHMSQRGRGLIINMASVAGHVPAPYMTSYVATKHAVVGFTRALQAELEMDASPVKTMLVSPGFVETKIIEKGAELGFPEWLSFMLSTPEGVAKAVIEGIRRDRREISPTMSGKMMLSMHRLAPRSTVRSSKLLLTRSFKDLMLNRFRIP